MGLMVRREPLLSERTTLGLGGKALAEAVVLSPDDLRELKTFLKAEGGRPLMLGAGSNILAPDEDLDLVLVRMEHRPDVAFEDHGETVRVRAGAGMRLPALLSELAKAGLEGLAGLAGIPGTVGGALAMNAGSYDDEFGPTVRKVLFWNPTGGLGWKNVNPDAFGYRKFSPALEGAWLAVEVELELRRGDEAGIRQTMRDAMAKKRATQPVNAKSAGCVFKNPKTESAGLLLDRAGFKGRRIGGMGFSDLHANFLINHGGGTSAQARELIEEAAGAVKDRFGVELKTEVMILS